jgi:hypothetical protein
MSSIDPYALAIEVSDIDRTGVYDHACITVRCAAAQHDDYPALLAEHCTLAEVTRAFAYVAGVLGRLVAGLASDLEVTQAVNHGCQRHSADYEQRCRVSAWYLWQPCLELDDPPVVDFTVPADRVDHWVTRIREGLETIATADTWMPTADDELAWKARGRSVDAPPREGTVEP